MPSWIKILIILLIIGAVAVLSYGFLHKSDASKAVQNDGSVRYLPLGDSYTIGQSVRENDRWPNQLTNRLASDGIKLKIIENPSVTGYTTQDLIDRELPLIESLKPDFVSILIGVNDYVQGVSVKTYATQLDYIIKEVKAGIAEPQNIVLVTIPDYGLTPAGAQFGSPIESQKAIIQLNEVIAAAGKLYGLPVADIFPASQRVATDPTLVASDGLHPSGKQYQQWTDVIYMTLKDAGLPVAQR